MAKLKCDRGAGLFAGITRVMIRGCRDSKSILDPQKDDFSACIYAFLIQNLPISSQLTLPFSLLLLTFHPTRLTHSPI